MAYCYQILIIINIGDEKTNRINLIKNLVSYEY